MRGRAWGVALTSSLQDALDVGFGHSLSDFPVNDGSAGAIEDGAQVIERAGQVEVGHIDMPVLVRQEGLLEAGAFLGGSSVPTIEATRLGQDPVHRGRAYGNNVLIEHHEGQAPVALQRIQLVKVEDGLPFPVFEPVIARDEGVVLVGLAIAFSPVEELASGQLEPGEEALDGQLGLFVPVAHEVHHGIADIMGNPAAGQGSPSSFFSWTYSPEISAMTESFLASLASR